MPISRIVDSWGGGTWAIRQMFQTPPLSVHQSLQEAVDAAIAEVANAGGGEVVICDQQGQVRDRRVVYPSWPAHSMPLQHFPGPVATAGNLPDPNGKSARSSSGRNWKRVAEVVGLIGVVIGIIFTVLAYVRPPEPPTESGKLNLLASSGAIYYYPPNGKLPSLGNPPPDFSGGSFNDHCDQWQEWFRESSIAPIGESSMTLEITASSTSPISIVRLKTDVLAKKPTGGPARIRCGYGAAGFDPHTLRIEMDRSAVPILERGGPNGGIIGPLPPSSFRVDESAAETLTLDFEGKEGYLYEYSIRVEYSENGENKVAEFGTSEDPILLLPKDTSLSGSTKYDWSVSENQWIVAPVR